MSDKEMVKQLLLSSNYWALNKTVVAIFGIETAFLLSNLAEAEQMMSDNNGWFYQTSDTLEELTTLSRYKQDKALDELEKAGILERDVRGIPAKRYFKLDYKSLANKIVKNSQTRVKKTYKLECEKLTTNKESINKQSINKKDTNKPSSAELTEWFEKVWSYYPRKEGKATAKKVFMKEVKKADKPEDMYKKIGKSVYNYAGMMKKEQRERTKIKTGGVFFNNAPWEDEDIMNHKTPIQKKEEKKSLDEVLREQGGM